MPEITSAKLSILPELLPSGAHTRVIDVGCGDGRHIAEAARRGCRAVGVDYDAGELRKARERTRALGVDYIVADATRLPFRSEAFDATICTETLEHLPDDEGAMRELARVMKGGALLHGAVPSHFTERLYWRLSAGYRTAPGGHVRIYDPPTLFRRLARAGLRPHGMRYVHFVDSVVWLRFCVTDALRRRPLPRSAFEAAVMIAEAQEQPVATWRTALRAAMPRSRLIGAIDRAGALVWPKSVMFLARKD
jgi:SAM-dependent methyltransferase